MGHIRLSDPPSPSHRHYPAPPNCRKKCGHCLTIGSERSLFSMAVTADRVAVNIAAFRPLMGFIC